MSQETRRNLLGGVGLAIATALLVTIWVGTPLWSTKGRVAVREIVLEARDVAFGGDNPTLHLTPGERVRFVIRNNDPGVLHSITIPGVDPTIRHIPWGEEVSFEVTIPDEGRFEYLCPQHAPKMKGEILVRSQS